MNANPKPDAATNTATGANVDDARRLRRVLMGAVAGVLVAAAALWWMDRQPSISAASYIWVGMPCSPAR